MSLISNCGQDEKGRTMGGVAGDQTGKEWCLMPWYVRPWNCVMRHPDEKVRRLQAAMARAAAENPYIGYDQMQRDTFGIKLRAAGDDPAKITEPCESDCSKGIIDITKAIGRITGRKELQTLKSADQIPADYTANMRAAYKNSGYLILTSRKYLDTPDYLMEGDILLNDALHVVTNLETGYKVKKSDFVLDEEEALTKKGYMKKGDRGVGVEWMQKMLIRCGYSCGAAGDDGEFGTDTQNALFRFQEQYGLIKDGEYGRQSKKQLEEVYRKNS